MKEIPISRGLTVLVDDEDYEEQSRHRWQALKGKRGKFYAARTEWVAGGKGKKRYYYMHREIMGNPKGIHVDHHDGNSLDNRRSNLRTCSNKDNSRNSVPKGKNRYKGVRPIEGPRGVRWKAYIKVDYRQIHLGTHATEDEAAAAYNDAALLYFGEFALLNDVPGYATPKCLPV